MRSPNRSSISRYCVCDRAVSSFYRWPPQQRRAHSVDRSAQQAATQGFADSWYWGVYGGGTSFADVGRLGEPAHQRAVDRRRLDDHAQELRAQRLRRSDVLQHALVHHQPHRDGSAARQHHATCAGSVSRRCSSRPSTGRIKPYFGVGYSFNFINSAALRTCSNCVTFPTQAAADSNQQAIVDAKAMGKVFGNVGVMYVWKRFAPFAQYTLMPTQGAWDWYINGTGFTSHLDGRAAVQLRDAIEKF